MCYTIHRDKGADAKIPLYDQLYRESYDPTCHWRYAPVCVYV
jgi:hypothetical protein